MKVTASPIPEVLIIEPKVFGDPRGFFAETFRANAYAELGITQPFVQDNWSRSAKGALRGMHFQHPRAQGKLVMVTRGAVFDVVADVRVGSPTFGKWFGAELSGDTRKQLWVPPGFAHGFCTLEDDTDFFYKCTDYYAPSDEHAVAWNDPQLAIDWPKVTHKLSARDQAAPFLKDAKVLPQWSPR
ncbi:MAG: dTDP-4-dehydrorhamnose 3,5-epimerase [Myxococcaceae bacterium]